jgi:hypothetical protein
MDVVDLRKEAGFVVLEELTLNGTLSSTAAALNATSVRRAGSKTWRTDD